jgi:hypothetical protein
VCVGLAVAGLVATVVFVLREEIGSTEGAVAAA